MKFRCSSIGKLMTEPKSIDVSLITPEIQAIINRTKRTDEEKALIARLKGQTLSETAKTYVKELAAQEIFGIDFEISGKQLEKGIEVEQTSIEMLNRVRGLSLAKNTERKENEWITGECDIFDSVRNRGHDIKSSWSAATFPIITSDCEDSLYEWQMRGYMALWNASEWEVDYCLVSTPERLIGFEPWQMHLVDHIPEHMRVTSLVIKRDMGKEAAMYEKVKQANAYLEQVINEFNEQHKEIK